MNDAARRQLETEAVALRRVEEPLVMAMTTVAESSLETDARRASSKGVLSGDITEKLRRDILARRAKIGVIGLGYVGLPLGVAFGEVGFEVLGFDVNAERIRSLNDGVSHIPDVPMETVSRLVSDGFLHATNDMERLSECDVISICVPTPLSRLRDPDISYVVTAASQVASGLRPGQVVILESTTYPGTTREVILPLLEESGLRVGEEFFLAFSPERVDPGNSTFSIRTTPKVVGGLDDRSTELASLFYRQAISTVVPVSSPETAEFVKLHENVFRSVNIALANETALMCDRLGLNVWEVIDAAATKPFGFMPFRPGPGIGGHCIPLDPFYLSWKMNTLDYRARFIDLAGEINDEMPHHVVNKVVDALNRFDKRINGADVLVLGVAYKSDIDDYRESPALDIIQIVRQRGAKVRYSDPHVPYICLGGEVVTSEPLTAELLGCADCVVIVTNHRAVDWELVERHAQLIVDTRNAISSLSATSDRVIRI